MALTLSSVVFAIVACLLQYSTRADILFEPGYLQAYTQQTPSNYMPMANQQQYSPYLRSAGYSPMQYLSTPYQSMPMVSSQYDPRSSLESEYQRYQELNKLVQQEIDETIQNSQMKNFEPNFSASLPRTSLQSWIPYSLKPPFRNLQGGMMYSLTPQGLKPVNNPQMGIYNGIIPSSPQQQGYYQNSQTGAGRSQWTRSVQPTGTDDGDDSSSVSEVQELNAVAAQSAVTETSVTDIPELGSLNESDKLVKCRAIGQADSTIVGSPLQASQRFDFVNDHHHQLGSSPSQIFEQIPPNFSDMGSHNGISMLGAGKQDISQVKVGEWNLSDADTSLAQQHLGTQYQKDYNQAIAALQQTYPLYQGHSGYLGNMNPSNPMDPNHMNSYGGHGSYNQGAYDSANVASGSPLSRLSNNPNTADKTALDYLQKVFNFQPSDWARFGKQWAQSGILAGL